LKLDITIRNFRDAAEPSSSKSKSGNPGDRIPVGEVRLKEPAEIEAAWENLGVSPRRLMRIASIRESLCELDGILNGLDDSDRLVFEQQDARETLDFAHDVIAAVADACSIIVNSLAPEIEALAPMMKANERMASVYSEPPAD
jgi:hypothetical protein